MANHRWVLFLALGAFFCPPARGASLYPAPIYETGHEFSDIAGGDFNGDSVVDLVIAHPYDKLLTLLPGVGDGTLGPPSTSPAPQSFRKVLAADLNGDGRLDIVGLHSGFPPAWSSVEILLGNGDGTFVGLTPILLSTFRAVYGIALGDLDGDMIADLAVVSDYPLFTLKGRADGSFAAPVQIPALDGNSVVIGDFNRDGRADLAIGSFELVRVLLGLGGGAFGPATTITAGSDNNDIETADFDNDGDLDLVTSSYFPFYPPYGHLNVLLGNGAGAFSLAGTYGTAGDGRAVSAIDLDHDGVIDLATAGRTKLDVFKGLGGGTFAPRREYGAGATSNALIAADLNGDGALDLAAGAYWVTVFLNDGAGGLGQPRFGSSTVGGGRLATGDFNEDGRPDLVAADQFGHQVRVLLADGPGAFQAESTYEAGLYPGAIAIGDFNGDQHQDLAIAAYSSTANVTILLGQGDGSFTLGPTLLGGEDHNAIAVGDFNADGMQDIVVTNGSNSNVLVYINAGNLNFAGTRYECDLGPVDVDVSDMDGDGIQDLVVVVGGGSNSTNDKIAILRGVGDGSFAPATFIPIGVQLNSGAVGDFNDDSNQDIAVTGDSVSVLLGLGGGQFAPRTGYPNSLGASLVTGDFDGDSTLDIAEVSGYFGTGSVAVLRGDGLGTFAPIARFAVAGDFRYGPYDLGVSDFNGDGHLDFALASDGSTATILLSQGPPLLNRAPVANAGSDRTLECASPAGRAVTLDSSLSSDPDSTPGTHDDIVRFEWFEDLGTPSQALLGTGETLTVTLPLGAHALSLVVTDSGGLTATDQVLVSVVDTTPPALLVSLEPAVLWPPNHRMVQVTASVSATDACGPASVSLLSVISSEPDDAPGGGDGATTNDIQGAVAGAPDFEFLLRAERATGGPGRTYTATYRALDGSQNSAEAAATAVVVHDQNGMTDPITLTVSQTPAGTLLTWPGVPGAVSYSAISGPLELLLSMGHDPSVQPAACLATGLAGTDTTGFEDASVPLPGRALFYLVEYDDGHRSGFGAQSTFWDRTEAVGANPCP